MTSLAMGDGSQADGEDTALKVCFATQQSLGDSADDYVMLANPYPASPLCGGVQCGPLSLAPRPSFDPIRFKAGAEQTIKVMNDRRNSAIVWTTANDCAGLGTQGQGTSTRTQEYPRFGFPSMIFFPANTNPVEGTWHTCYRPYTVCAPANLLDAANLEWTSVG